MGCAARGRSAEKEGRSFAAGNLVRALTTRKKVLLNIVNFLCLFRAWNRSRNAMWLRHEIRNPAGFVQFVLEMG